MDASSVFFKIMNKKYLPSALILYLNYFIHGVGCSILGQAVIKDSLAASWGVQAMAITAISAALGLGRLIALPFAGPLSDKLGRRISCVIGGASYAIYLIGLAFAFNAGANGGYQIAYICAILGGIANSFLDTGIYPAVGEIFYSAPGVATMGIKFFIAISHTGTFQLGRYCAQNFAKEVVGWADPSIMQTYYSMGTMLALIVTALLTRKIRDVRFIMAYPIICLAAMILVLLGKSQMLCIAGAFVIGWAGAGGLLQIVTSVCNMLFPRIKGTVTALVMIASSLCNYTILTAASKMTPSGVMVMNIVLTAIGVILGIFVNIRYAKMVELASEE